MNGSKLMDPALKAANDDAMTICASLGAVASMCLHAQEMAKDGTSLAHAKDESARDIGARIRDDAASALKAAREKIHALMEDFGNFFNGGDACTPAMEDLTEPVYAMLRKRAEGKSLDD